MPPTSQPSGPNTPGGEPYCDWKSWMKRRTSGRVDDPRSTHAHVTTVPSPAPAVVERYDSVFIADEPNSGIASAPPSVSPVRRSVAPGPDPVHATLPHPDRSTRCTTPARASSSGRTSDPAMSRRAEIRREQRPELVREARPIAHETGPAHRSRRYPYRGRQRCRLAGQPGDDPPPRRPSLRGEGGPQLGQAERGDAGAVQERSHRRGLRPERADHRRHERRIVHHRLGERVRLRLVPFDVQADHLGHHRQVPAIDRLLERELQTEERGSHRLRGPGNRHVVQERDLHGHGVGSGRAARRRRPCTRRPGSRPGRPERRRSRGVGSCRFGSPRTRERADGWVV